MIVTSCPLRVSLVGGSTDNPKFIETYGHGSVISFASNMRTYVAIQRDLFGINAIDKKFTINYSKQEKVNAIDEIQNDVVRECFKYLGVTEQINCTLTSDAYSANSGLASSSAYIQALIKAIYVVRGISITQSEICSIAEQIEKRINPLVGQQDFYGSFGGLKRIDFYKDKAPQIRYLNNQIFTQMDCYLLYTKILRSSTEILKNISIEKSLPLLEDVDQLERAININDVELFNSIINKSWENKKNTSSQICDNESLMYLDKELLNDKNVLSRKLCGAGGGGFFLIIAQKNCEEYFRQKYSNINKISISETGIEYINFHYEFKKI